LSAHNTPTLLKKLEKEVFINCLFKQESLEKKGELDVEFRFPEIESMLSVQVAHELVQVAKFERGLVWDLKADHVYLV